MTITINDSPITFVLERERTLGELLAGVEQWLEQKGFSLSALAVNGETIAIEHLDAACARDLEEIELLDIKASTWTELLSQALRVAQGFVCGGEPAAPKTIEEWQRHPASSFLAARYPDMHAQVCEVLQGTAVIPTDLVCAHLEEREQELTSPLTELETVARIMESTAARLEELPLELQTGKDVLAAQTIQGFTSLVEKLYRLLPILRLRGVEIETATVGPADFKTCMTELNAALKEILAAYSSGDAVLVGDLSEYELAPRLRDLAPALASVAAS